MNPPLPTEIERRFLLSALPERLDGCPRYAICQGYLAVENDRNVRLRSRNDDFYLTSKQGDGMERIEVETRLTAEQFRALWPLTEGRRIEKERYLYSWEGHTVEIDVFGGRHAGLILAEVEFTTLAEAEAFIPPEFLGEEVTGRREYGNASLALQKN